jgi:hypothetical protein
MAKKIITIIIATVTTEIETITKTTIIETTKTLKNVISCFLYQNAFCM